MPAKLILPEATIKEMTQRFKNGTSIPELMSLYKLSRNKITSTLRENLGESYKHYAQEIIKLSGKKAANKIRGRKNPHTQEHIRKIAEANRGKKLSDETKKKISEASKSRYERGTWTKKQHREAMKKAIETKRKNGYFKEHSKRHSSWMKENCPNRGKTMSDEAKKNMSISKLNFYKNGGVPPRLGKLVSSKVKNKLSLATSKLWREGRFTYNNPNNWRSKLEIQVFEHIKSLYPNAKHSYRIHANNRTYVFDIYVPDLNLLIEVNGDYWHLNPRLYEQDHYDKHRDVTLLEVHKRDSEKLSAAQALGFNTKTIWELDLNEQGINECVEHSLI